MRCFEYGCFVLSVAIAPGDVSGLLIIRILYLNVVFFFLQPDGGKSLEDDSDEDDEEV